MLGTALASFAGTKTVKTGALVAAKLATPTGLATANGGCAGGSGQTNVSSTWTASAELDANGNPLINGYKLSRSTSSGGVYSEVGTTGIATSFTDVNPSGAETPQVFVGNGGLKTVRAVKTSTNEGASLATSGTIGIEPNSMAVNPEGTKVVVAEGASHQVQIITVSSHAVGAAVAIPEVAGIKSRPDAVAITPNGLTAYVVDGANNLVYPLTISTGTLGAGIAVGAQGDPGAIVVTPNGEKVYVANYSSHNVSVITTASNTVTATVTIGAGETGKPIALAVTPSSAHVYVADQGNAQVDDITTASDTVTKTIAVGSMADANVVGGGDPNILAVTPEGSKLYVASYTAGTVADIATSTDTVTNTITLPGTTPNPNALALTPNGCQLYVHDHANNQVDAVTVSSDGSRRLSSGRSHRRSDRHVGDARQRARVRRQPQRQLRVGHRDLDEHRLRHLGRSDGRQRTLRGARDALTVLLQAAGGARRLAERPHRVDGVPAWVEPGRVAVDVSAGSGGYGHAAA